ncbi:hypothetical protein tinsulaeT_34480 [Thalassotalea insulae]|uniref:Uncharacterized protein n=1 Tax=Thalassotalea insulae TaxID=2056778 RepID=A0ABQ6GW00_9GAMM|nr:hypothetical protein [Thalassotalea insulae]GLX80108.1 hypothetical protein tinsulaeT_34480 [Thalassotalea insulae]
MSELSVDANLKEINAFKKKICWGDVPAIYHMAQNTVSELDGLFIHGFDNAFKRILDRNNWNLDLLQGYQGPAQEIRVKIKPKIMLKHFYDEQNYELQCVPIVQGEGAITALNNHPLCPFIQWQPEAMSKLYKASNLVAFIQFAFNKGDQADMALLRYAHIKILQLIEILNESFDIVSVKGYNIAQFCQEIHQRKNLFDTSDLHNNSIKDAE